MMLGAGFAPIDRARAGFEAPKTARSRGRCSQGIPVFNTNKIPVNTLRSSIRFRPGYRCRRFTFGISGSTKPHSSSLTNGCAIALILPNEVDSTPFVSETRVPAFR
jgi:hypothetical protein